MAWERISELQRIKYALRPVKELYATLPASEFSPSPLKVVRHRLVDGGLCRRVTNDQLKRIVRMLKRVASEDRIPAYVYETLRYNTRAEARPQRSQRNRASFTRGDRCGRGDALETLVNLGGYDQASIAACLPA